ncbi:NAD-dependent epimerase/dehydratase family protein [Fictibacillus terranigra]|uniref:NAD-dependent epimerase/dehydratase family protein n=1 Tax=Fictibacillus terranigra TaxID=3058424 RepID=A0ABT8E6Z0_9BACL|nr:NAD-dependent epimerase/dehydratase family protein [Fictibacillus sp. CENA-BCM004]MDN4073660.1 NAD-dependent epimerase/dehydratase family protein [Fictibacillus sp. CENA-BCM004]
MKAIVTGGAGFIGSHLVVELIEKGHEVHILDNLVSGHLKNVHPSAVVHIEDIQSNEAKQVIIKEQPDVVFHLAAQADVGKSILEPRMDASVNINGTINILEACHEASVKKIIFASTSAVYGDVKAKLAPENIATVPISYYGLSKLSAEGYIRLFYQLYALPFTILRYGNVYGPRQLPKGEGGVIAIFLDRIKKGQALTIFGDGQQTRDFIHVKDVVRANMAAIDRGDQEIFNVSTSSRTSLTQLIDHLQSIHGYPITTVNISSKHGDIKHSCLDHKKAVQLLGWKPYFDIYQGLQDTYSYSFRP